MARQVPRLAGLVWIPVTCIAKTAFRQQASWLAIKASVDVNLRWFFCRRSAPAPHTAPIGRGTVRGEASWLRSYRRSATGLAARGSGVDSCYLHSKDRHSATGLMAHNKGQRGCEPTLVFLQGQCPYTPDCALARWGVEGHAAWLRSYRRSDVDSCCLHSKDRHSATGLMARNKGQRGCEPTLAF